MVKRKRPPSLLTKPKLGGLHATFYTVYFIKRKVKLNFFTFSYQDLLLQQQEQVLMALQEVLH